MRRAISLLAATTLYALVASPGPALAQNVRLGALSCDVSGGIGLVITSKKALRCIYTPEGGGTMEPYIGSIEKFGLDIGATSRGQMLWIVTAPTRGTAPFALAGQYAGATAEASVGAGAGANALIGGSNRAITLQPVSIQAQQGLNLAVGVAALTLRPE
ncbi:MAG: DUF992 domain-containing protein [Pseudolabrys sp.]